MGADNSHKGKKKILKKKRKEDSVTASSQLAQNGVNFYGANEEVNKKHKKKKKKSFVDTPKNVSVKKTADIEDETSDGSKRIKKLKIKKRKSAKTRTGIEEVTGDAVVNEDEDGTSGKNDFESEPTEKRQRKPRKKKRTNVGSINGVDEVTEKDDASGRRDGTLPEKREDSEDEVYEMSSGDEDYSKGMKKWITQYHQCRPGLKVLQERIEDFIMDHEAQEEKARVEREVQAAEGGWTVVVHHKGRKKTTDAETGIAVGSVAKAAILDKMDKKKKKEVGLNFYRFQKRETQMNEIMMLQSKFEQDKKRIQQLRATRKFRPY